MAQKQNKKTEDGITRLRQEIKDADDEAQKNRLRAILCVKEGMSRVETGQKFVVHRMSVAAWIDCYETGGALALKMSKGGRPNGNPKWDVAIFKTLTKELDKGGRYWSVPLMQQWILEKYQKTIPENTIWYHVTNLDYSYKSARPHPFQGNAEKQAAFKKRASKKHGTN